MAPTKPNYNSVLTRANQSRDKVLQDTGGLVEEPEFIELNPDLYGVSFEDEEAAKKFTDELVQKTGKNFRIKRFENLNRPEVNRDIESRVQPQLPKEEGQLTGFQPKSGMLLPEMKQQTPPKVSLMPEMYPEPSLVPEGTLMNAPSAGEMPSAPLSPEEAFSAPEEETPALPAEAVSPTQERLNALASILKMTEGDEALRRKAYERTAMDAETGKIMQAMMAGLTRSPVPANVYEPTPAFQPEGRLSLLAKAANALRGVQDVTSAGSAGATGQKLASDSQKAWLKKYMPETYNALQESGTLDSATEAEWKSYVNLYAAKDKQGFQAQQNELNRLVKENAQEQQARQAINSEVSKVTKSPTVIRLTSTIPVLKGMLENDVFNKIESGSEVLNKIGLGQATPQEEQLFNAFFERLTAADRQQLFGATLTGNELASYNTMVGAGKNASTSTKLKLFANFVKSLKQGLQVQFAPFFIGQDAPDYAYRQQVYENFKTASKNATAENPIFDIVEQAASQRASELPQTMEEEARAVGERIRGAGGQALETAKQVGRGLLGRQEPSTAPVEEDRIEPMPSQAAPTPSGELTPAQKKRLEELRRKKAQGTLGE